MSTAHPRSRGENFTRPRPASVVCGSSPLTRGKRRRPHPHPERRRLIPAHAGKTSLRTVLHGVEEAHPRSRGENHMSPRSSELTEGSSPLTRGKHDLTITLEMRPRLIPAHAGKTGVDLAIDRSGAAHPRSRGENALLKGPYAGEIGSSPLTRGKPVHVPDLFDHCGLIPAHAGKTSWCCRRSGPRAAHPRSRGENISPTKASLGSRGSSPLTRGKLQGRPQ